MAYIDNIRKSKQSGKDVILPFSKGLPQGWDAESLRGLVPDNAIENIRRAAEQNRDIILPFSKQPAETTMSTVDPQKQRIEALQAELQARTPSNLRNKIAQDAIDPPAERLKRSILGEVGVPTEPPALEWTKPRSPPEPGLIRRSAMGFDDAPTPSTLKPIDFPKYELFDWDVLKRESPAILRAPKGKELSPYRTMTPKQEREVEFSREVQYLKEKATPEQKAEAFTTAMARNIPAGLVGRIIIGKDAIPENEAISAAFPFLKMAGGAAGQLYSYMTIGKVVQGLGIAAAATSKLTSTAAIEYVSRSVATGATMGIRAFLEEAAKARETGQVKVGESIKNIAEGTLFGATLGPIGAIPNRVASTAAAATLGGAVTYAKTGNEEEALVSSALMGAFMALTHKGSNQAFKNLAYKRTQEQMREFVKFRRPDLSPEESNALADRFMNVTLTKMGVLEIKEPALYVKRIDGTFEKLQDAKYTFGDMGDVRFFDGFTKQIQGAFNRVSAEHTPQGYKPSPETLKLGEAKIQGVKPTDIAITPPTSQFPQVSGKQAIGIDSQSGLPIYAPVTTAPQVTPQATAAVVPPVTPALPITPAVPDTVLPPTPAAAEAPTKPLTAKEAAQKPPEAPKQPVSDPKPVEAEIALPPAEKPPVEALKQEALKYKTAEEFRKGMFDSPLTGNFGERFGVISESRLPDVSNQIRKTGGREAVEKIKQLIQTGDPKLGKELGSKIDRVNSKTLQNIYGRGQVPPISVEKLPKGTIEIVDGKHRLQAYRELGIKEIPIANISDTQSGFLPEAKSQLTDIWKEAHAKPEVKAVKADIQEPTTRVIRAAPKKLKTQEQIKREAKMKARQEAMAEIKDIGMAKSDMEELIRQRRYDLNLATYETNLFINELNRNTTRLEREALPFIIEGTPIPAELARPDLTGIDAGRVKELKKVAAQIKKHFHATWQKIQENTNDMTATEIENYVTHIWDIPKSKKAEITNWFSTRNRFLKKRYIPTLADGIKEFGLKPKILDIGEIIRVHDIVSNRVIENNKLVNQIKRMRMPDGTPLIAPSNKAPADWVSIHHPALQAKLFVPGPVKMGEKISSELQDILSEMGVSIGRRISPVAFGKPMQVAGLYVPGEPPAIRLQRFFTDRTLAHEIGHHLDKTLNLGESFVNRYKDEIYSINKDRIERLSKRVTSKYGKEYAESTEEQIAEVFSLLFTDAQKAVKMAPGATDEILSKLNNDEVLAKLVDYDFAVKSKNLLEESVGTLISVPLKVHPDLADTLKVVFESTITSPLIQAYESVNAYLKKTSLTLSLFHPVALTESSVATMGIRKTLALWSPRKIYRALRYKEMPVFNDVEIARDAIRHGLQIGATVDIPVGRIQNNLNNLARKTGNIPLINAMTKYTAAANENWDILLWNYYQSSLKLYGYEHLQKYIDPSVDVDKQKREIAALVNDTYGGQNWDTLMVNPKQVQIMSWLMLSPDWTISAMVRQPLAPTGLGAVHKETEKLRRKLGMIFWIRAAVIYGTGINLLNILTRKYDEQKNPQYYAGNKPKGLIDYTMFGNTIGNKTRLFTGRYADGSERYLRWGKQFREIPELMIDGSEISPISATIKKVGGKMAPAIQNIYAITAGVSPSGYTQRDVYGKHGWDRVKGSLLVLVKAPVPFSLRRSMESDKEFAITDIAMPSGKGLTRFKAIEYFKQGIKKYQKSGDERMVIETYQSALQNNLSAFDLFEAALTTLRAEENRGAAAYSKTIATIEKAIEETNDIRIEKALSNRVARLYKEQARKEDGLELLDSALDKLREEAE